MSIKFLSLLWDCWSWWSVAVGSNARFHLLSWQDILYPALLRINYYKHKPPSYNNMSYITLLDLSRFIIYSVEM